MTSIMTPGQHRAEVRRLCQIGRQPTAREIRRAYLRYLARRIWGI